MQLILELFKKIFVALQGVYTKAETDSALATKADTTALTEEAQAREQADAAHTQSIDSLKLATDYDWKTYMLEKAKQTGSVRFVNLVLRVAKEYSKDSSSVLGARMISDWRNLSRSEDWTISQGGESPWTVEFWVEYFNECVRWEKNPSETLVWSLDSGNNPFGVEAPTKPVVNFSVTNVQGGTNVGLGSSFSKELDVPVYLPSCKNWRVAFGANKSQRQFVFRAEGTNIDLLGMLSGNSALEIADIEFGSAARSMSLFHSCSNLRRVRVVARNGNTELTYLLYSCPNVEYLVLGIAKSSSVSNNIASFGLGGRLKTLVYEGGLPLAKTLNNISSSYYSNSLLTHISFSEDDIVSIHALDFPSAEDIPSAFRNFRVLNQPMSFPVLKSGDDAYLNSGMSADNIAYVLDSLPEHTDGEEHIITFTGCPGASELTQESESVAAATARGWTVEL